jgi:hypothetical protein
MSESGVISLRGGGTEIYRNVYVWVFSDVFGHL